MSEVGPSTRRPESDIYTVLLIVATLFLAVGTIILAARSQQLFGSWVPFGR